MKFAVLICFFAIIIFSILCRCSKNDESDIAYDHGLLLNMSAFDGCGWIIELDDQTTMEPTNLSEFNISLQDSAQVGVRYLVTDNQNSDCMMGTVVKLLDIYYEN